MDRRFLIYRRGILATAVFMLLQSAPLIIPRTAVARDLFPGYPAVIRTQAERVLAVARPGKDADLAKEVRSLRIRMHGLGILSINSLPDLLFDRAIREGWKKEAAPVLRVVREVSPFSVPMWAWLVKEDLVAGNLPDFLKDMDGLTGAIRRFAPAVLGYASWLLSFLSAAGCWFVLWGSSALFLRARPSLEGDLQRFLKIPYREYMVPVIVALVFLLPLLAGCGLAVVASVWLMLSVAYMRRGELVIMTTVILVLAALLVGGGILHSLKVFGGNHDGGKGRPGIPVTWMRLFEKAAQEMQSGDAGSAENRWTRLIDEGIDIPEVFNNRGIVRAQQGKIKEALADFETAAGKSPEDPSAHWNAYQIHLMMFNLDRVRQVQPMVWDGIQKMSPFLFSPADMEQGEWIASPIPARYIWEAVLAINEDWMRYAGESDLFVRFFHPLSAPGAIVFLAAIWLSYGTWNLLSRKLWVHGTCLSCGARALVVRSRESSDLCPPCRVKLGGGVRLGHERTRRVQGIVQHRWFVMAASLAVPGVGALWSGKVMRTFGYGVALSLTLAALTCSLGGGREGGPLIADLQRTVLSWAFAVAVMLWIGGAAWGMRSFTNLQRDRNIAGLRV